MKKSALLNSDLSAVISRMGHTDGITLGDCGLPIPNGVERIDLAVKRNLPRLLDVLETLLKELCVEKAVVAEELIQNNQEMYEQFKALLPGVEFKTVLHEEFKQLTRSTKAVVRTGECTPYANIILYSGVDFTEKD